MIQADPLENSREIEGRTYYYGLVLMKYGTVGTGKTP